MRLKIWEKLGNFPTYLGNVGKIWEIPQKSGKHWENLGKNLGKIAFRKFLGKKVLSH